VKLVVSESESTELRHHLAAEQVLTASGIALVEVPRATSIADPTPETERDTEELLASCTVVDVDDSLLRAAAVLASESLRTLDAIHLASALRVEADEFITYDRHLGRAAAEAGLVVVSPGR
jgi:uncharacterized protein